MKLFSAQWIDHPASSPCTAGSVVKAAFLVLALTLVSCVSEPPATSEPDLQEASQVVETATAPEVTVPPESQSTREVPSIISSMRVSGPLPHVVIVTLAEPDLPPPPVMQPVIPTEITVLSTMPAPVAAVTAATVSPPLPEPVAPVPVPVPAAPAKAAPARAAPAKAAATPAAKPAAPAPKPAPVAPAKAETLKTTEPAPVVIAPTPAVELPVTPPSQARSIAAATPQPVAETRIETVRGERFELRFPGTGWIYLGDEAGKEGLRYETRRFEATQAVFAMNPETVGEYLLRFQRQNPVDQATETSLVRVLVTERTNFATATAASTAAEPVPAPSDTVPVATIPSAVETIDAATSSPSTVPPLVDPVSLLKLARTELEAKRIQSAIDALDHYLALYPYGNDEVFYLYGLAYEQDTPFRDIKKSWEYYRRVRDEYPRSPRWTAAADRIGYLEKHYFGLR